MPETFATRFNGNFKGILRWPQLDALWERVRSAPEGWYATLTGEAPPTEPLDRESLLKLITELDELLRREHDYDYCGIVYADNPEKPEFIKIYDPHNLGSSCGSSGTRIPPRWVLSRIQPEEIKDDAPLPGSRRRWWQRIFG